MAKKYEEPIMIITLFDGLDCLSISNETPIEIGDDFWNDII